METLVTLKVSIVLWPVMEPKERILVKSHELFDKYGIRSVSMDDIATQLGMSKKTLYQYYTDKDELVHAVFTTVLEGNKSNCCLAEQHAEDALHEAFRVAVEQWPREGVPANPRTWLVSTGRFKAVDGLMTARGAPRAARTAIGGAR